jgi:glycosyltransferase involved in cell wall biosynthesis
MRTVILTRRFPPESCGVGDFAWRLAEALAARGEEAVIMTQPASGGRPAGMRVVEVPMRGWRDVAAIARGVAAQRPDAVQIEYSSYAWGRWGVAFWVNALALLLRLRGLRVRLACHELYIIWYARPKLILTSLLQRLHFALLFFTVNEIMTNTPGRVEILRCWVPWKRSVVHYRPNSSNIPFAPLGAGERLALRRRRGAAPDSLVVAAFGRFAAAKNYGGVIEAAARLGASRDVRLWLLGDWEAADSGDVARLRARVRAAGIEDRVFWSGRLSVREVSAHLQAADIFLLPQPDGHLTRSGAFMAAAEHGLPVVAVRNVREQREFAHRENVWLVANSSAAEFAEALEMLAAAAPLRARLGENLRRLYHARFSFSAVLSSLERGSPAPLQIAPHGDSAPRASSGAAAASGGAAR